MDVVVVLRRSIELRLPYLTPLPRATRPKSNEFPLRAAAVGVDKRGIAHSSFLRAESKKEGPVASSTTDKPHDPERILLAVNDAQSSLVSAAAHDVGWKAVAFNNDLVKKMTPIKRKFVLQDKVAVMTGYVRFCF